MPILLIRHGHTTQADASGSHVSGWTDLPLTAQGEEVMYHTAHAVSTIPFSRLLSSDLARARVSAGIIGNQLGVPVVSRPELRPWHLGGLQGLAADAAKDDIEQLLAHPSAPAPDGGESFHYFLKRFLPFILPYVRDPRSMTAVVTHSRNIKALDSHLRARGFGVDLDTWRRPGVLEPGGAAIVDPQSIQVIYQPSQELTRA